ncbi:AUGMIN subunit 7-like [Zingiber officinale]|uniref:AUGMIN subunit 7-like n=1 Tax=Zingiber officinale TaxID=94328 RepID=UPI001C4CAABD|nr:AUGMIN subunit 7-like [Zingiber officinale]
MASRQMEAIQRKLELLNYPRCNAPSQSLLFAGVERYALLEWLFFRLLGDRSPFTQQNWQGDSMDRDEENTRIQREFPVDCWLMTYSYLTYPIYFMKFMKSSSFLFCL